MGCSFFCFSRTQKVATRRHAVAAALALRLKGLNITTDLMQVGKVVTGQQL